MFYIDSSVVLLTLFYIDYSVVLLTLFYIDFSVVLLTLFYIDYSVVLLTLFYIDSSVVLLTLFYIDYSVVLFTLFYIDSSLWDSSWLMPEACAFIWKVPNQRALNFCNSSGRWQAPAAVLPEGPKDTGYVHSRARRAREWPKHASPRDRRARGRAKLGVRFGACQCYYMFFTTQLKIANFTA